MTRPAPPPSPLDDEITAARALAAELGQAYAAGMAELGRAALQRERALYVPVGATVTLTPELEALREECARAEQRVSELTQQRFRQWVATL